MVALLDMRILVLVYNRLYALLDMRILVLVYNRLYVHVVAKKRFCMSFFP
jgi:hypothetical protein